MMKKNINWLFLLLLFVFFIGLKLYIVYFGYIYYHYIVPPGYDAIPHFENIKNLADKNVWANFIGYPKLFHYMIFYLSQIFHKDPFYILAYWTPAMIILPSISIYFLLKQIFNIKTAGIASLFFLFTANYPLYGFVDGNYPNILGYGFFAIFCLAFIIKYIKTKKLLFLYISALFYILTGLTHHFSFAELNGVLSLSLLIMVIARQIKLSRLRYRIRIFPVIFLSFFLLFLLFFAYKLYGSQFTSFFTGLISNKSAIHDAYLNQAVQYYRYPEIVGPIIWYGGTFGLFYMIITFLKSQKKDYTKLIIFIWIILIYLLSRLPSSGLPERFARELAVPLAICFAYLIDRIINHVNDLELNRQSLFVGYGFMAYLIILNSSLYSPVLLDSLPNSFSNMVWFNEVDQVKSDYIQANFSKNNQVFINQYANPYMELKNKGFVVNIDLESIANARQKANDDPKNQQLQTVYQNLITQEVKKNINKSFLINPKPLGNTDSVVYPIFSGFEAYNSIMNDIARDQKIIKKFADGAIVVRIEKPNSKQ